MRSIWLFRGLINFSFIVNVYYLGIQLHILLDFIVWIFFVIVVLVLLAALILEFKERN